MSSKNTTASRASKLSKYNVVDVEVVDEAVLWEFKREWQRRDVESVRSGRRTPDRMSWFSRKKAQGMRLIDSPY